jgi:hypothetical protein
MYYQGETANLTFALDIFLIVLLVLAIGYGFVLNRRIVALRRDQKDLDKLAASFNAATVRAEAGVAQLRSATENSVRSLQQSINKAETIIGDLDYLLERGERTADRLEGAVRSGEGLVPGERGRRPEGSDGSDLAENNLEERELLKALRAVR